MNPVRTLAAALKVLPLFILSGCSALQLVNSVSRIYTADTRENIPFDSNPALKFDLYLPEKPADSAGPTPVVVFFYGGSWNRGNKSEYEFVGRRLASMGYIAAVPNYRLYPEVSYPDFLIDNAKSVKAILNELQKSDYSRYQPDSRVVLMGHSAGAYNAAMLAYDERWLKQVGLNLPSTVKGFVGIAGAYNLYPINDVEVRPVFHHPNYPKNSQPIDFAANTTVPSLILAPESDNLVSIEINSVALHKALDRAQVPNRYLQVKGTDHITIIGTFSPVLFFKGSTSQPIAQFVESLQGVKSSTPMVNQQAQAPVN
ncbi:alpha/beta hydrolase [Limnobacter humi]|uniref:Alpha/beta hydrolase n=1 Tax=Limnobacter humi TaxID=1778671 RepID=A0ABT1WGH5_9BURK|nr:alpha/beta hydrolase [Limnobacter humi]MCQ8896626.1 alpha/beta hydrolase [Limnobacter humi]